MPPPRSHAIADPAHPGQVVGAFGHPADWAASSAVFYNLRDQNGIGLVFARTCCPDGTEGCEFFPNEVFYASPGGDMLAALGGMGMGGMGWGASGPGRYQVMIGGMAFGASFRPPAPAGQVLASHMIPRYRGNRPGLRVLGMRPAPWLLGALGNEGALMNTDHDAAAVRITYQAGPVPIEEEFLGCAYRFPPDGSGTMNWGVTLVRSFWARAGQLDAVGNDRLQLLASLQLNPAWVNWLRQLGAQLNAGQHAALGQMRQDMFANEAREAGQRAEYFNWHQGVQGDLAAMRASSDQYRQEGMGDMLSGRTRYVDPSSRAGLPYEDRQHHAHMWTDGQGNFRGTNDPNYDPNIGADRRWSLARRVDER